jgi:hypothetical protein
VRGDEIACLLQAVEVVRIPIGRFSTGGFHQVDGLPQGPLRPTRSGQTVIRLDKLRKQRNLTEYTGDVIPESAVAECLSQAESLHTVAVDWLKKHKPDLL